MKNKDLKVSVNAVLRYLCLTQDINADAIKKNILDKLGTGNNHTTYTRIELDGLIYVVVKNTVINIYRKSDD